MKKLIFILLGGFSIAAFSQTPLSNVQSASASVSGLLRSSDPAANFANSITESDLRAHLTFLASDLMEGRETGERGQRIAAQYLAAQFQRMGLKPPVKTGTGMSYFQEFNLEWIKLESAEINFGGKGKLKLLDDFLTFNRGAIENVSSGEFAFAGYGIEEKNYDNFQNSNVKGKVAIVIHGEPKGENGKFIVSGTNEESKWSDGFSNKGEAALAHGATALLVIGTEAEFNGFASSNWIKRSMTQGSLKVQDPGIHKGIPVYLISEISAAEIFKSAKVTFEDLKNKYSGDPSGVSFGKSVLNVKADVTKEIKTSENVLGFLEGTDKKDEIVILTAHYDHIGVNNGEVYNGADDDGSGTSTILEMAEAFSKAVEQGNRPRRSILFMPVSGEEKGLLGSDYYVRHPVFPLEKTVVDLNTDMIGRVDEKHSGPGEENYVYIIGSDKLSSELHSLNEEVNTKYTNLSLDYTYNSPDDPNEFYYRSDHYNFAKNNIPVIFFFTGVHVDYHKPGDDIEKIMFPKMTKIAKLIFLDAWEIANREGKLIVDKKNDFPEER